MTNSFSEKSNFWSYVYIFCDYNILCGVFFFKKKTTKQSVKTGKWKAFSWQVFSLSSNLPIIFSINHLVNKTSVNVHHNIPVHKMTSSNVLFCLVQNSQISNVQKRITKTYLRALNHQMFNIFAWEIS